MKTNYETLKEELLQDPVMQAKYILAKEKLNLELMLDSVKQSLTEGKQLNVIMRRINKMSNYINKIAL
jgi:hypothetical protein